MVNVRQILAIALVYWAFGVLAMALAFPLSYGVIIWPSAGIALACILRYGYGVWPGVLIGAVAVHITEAFYRTGDGFSGSFFFVAAASTGSVLQALGAAFLVRRNLSSLDLLKPVDIVKFLFWGGPAACVIHPLLTLPALLAQGMEPHTAVLTGCLYWVENTVGVLLFGPLTLAWIGKPREVWRPRRYILTLPLLVAFISNALILSFVFQMESKRHETVFKNSVNDFVDALQYKLTEIDVLLNAVKGFYASSVYVDRQEFGTFASVMLTGLSEIKYLAWAPRVAGESAGQYIVRARHDDGLRDFRLKELTSDGQMTDAGVRPEYFPIYYVEPMSQDMLLGFDLASSPGRWKAFETARDTGKNRASGPVNPLLDMKAPFRSIMLAAPVYAKGVEVLTIDDRRKHLEGFLMVSLYWPQLIQRAFKMTPMENILFIVDDVTSGQPEYVYRSSSEKPGRDLKEIVTLDYAGRTWNFTFFPSDGFHSNLQTWTLWLVALASLLLSSMLNILLLFMSGQTAEVKRLVLERTGELEKAKKKLEQQIFQKDALNRQIVSQSHALKQQHEEMVKILKEAEEARRKAEDAEHKAQEALKVKTEFISVVSHELRTPLTVIRESISQILEGFWGPLTDKQAGYMNKTLANIDRLRKIINNLLDVSKIEHGKYRIFRKNVNLKNLLEGVAAEFEPLVKAKGLTLKLAGDYPETDVFIDEDKIIQVFNNLIGNAVKFTERGLITVHAEVTTEFIKFTVEDSGKGIDTKDMGRLFKKFEQLARENGPGERGTGLGLVIAKEIVQMHGGSMGGSSRPGEGSKFYFTIPRHVDTRYLRDDLLMRYFMDLEKRFNDMTVIKVDCPDGVTRGMRDAVFDILTESLNPHDDGIKVFGRSLYAILPSASVAEASVTWETVYAKIHAQFPDLHLDHRIFTYQKNGNGSLESFVRRLDEKDLPVDS